VVIIAEFAAQPTADSPLQAPVATSNSLIQREQDVLELLTRQFSNQEIADRLFISLETVKRHTANMYRKLRVNNRRHAVEQATSQGILGQAPS